LYSPLITRPDGCYSLLPAGAAGGPAAAGPAAGVARRWLA